MKADSCPLFQEVKLYTVSRFVIDCLCNDFVKLSCLIQR